MPEEQIREFLSAIQRPLLFLSRDTQKKKLPSVANLSTHILDTCRRALAAPFVGDSSKIFLSLKELFGDYDRLEEAEKRRRVEQALVLLQPSKRKEEVCFKSEDHPVPNLERLEEAQGHLSKNVQYLRGVGPSIAQKFAKDDIRTVTDLLTFFPIRYEDRRSVTPIRELKEGETATITGRVKFSGVAFYRGLRRRVYEAVIEDETGELKLKWFHFVAGAFEGRMKIGQSIVIHGKARLYRNHFEMHHPDFEVFSGKLDSISFGRIVPVYRETGGLYQKTLRKIMNHTVSTLAKERVCCVPPEVCKKYDLVSPVKALLDIHLPRSIPDMETRTKAAETLSFEELFFYCLSIVLRKEALKDRKGISFEKGSARVKGFLKHLPFRLTQAQERVLETIRSDMAKPRPMNRLLQGDVGSGKTVEAFLAALIAIDNGYQAAFMAPTEILAEQHFKTLSSWAPVAKIRIGRLVGKSGSKDRKEILRAIRAGEIDLVVGTHALLEADVEFPSLGLVVVDEQHRFGVEQRKTLRTKGLDPDVLVMSATPIPRTLALTLYGDLDVSLLNELPAGRKPIETRSFRDAERAKVYTIVEGELAKGRQAFVIYPLVNPSDKIDLKDATGMAEHLKKDIFPNRRIELIHGQIPSAEKDQLMNRFRAGEIDLLVATTVVEVGIDVPNATMMVLEHPERFGLAQLHQLRGRVGRGTESSTCLLIVPNDVSKYARERLKVFCRVHDGFLLAEEDLRLRGPGDFFGVVQSGFPDFKAAVFPRDLDLLERARRETMELIAGDPRLERLNHRHLKWVLDRVWSERMQLVRIG